MIIHYSLSENDMLTHQLYLASKSERIKKNRRFNRGIVPLFYLLIAAWYFYQEKTGLGVMVLCLFLAWYFLYPIWERRRYTSYYKAFVNEHFQARIGRRSSIEFKDGALIAKDGGTESFILAGELTEIIELSQIFLLKIVTGEALVIPANDIEDVESLKAYLKNIALERQIDYTAEPSWSWE